MKFLTEILAKAGITSNYFKLDTSATPPIEVGKVVWNAADGTFDMGLLNNVTLQAGQELHFYGKAVGAISNGQAVMFAGAQGDHALMTLADAATINANPEYFIGVATQDFANNDFGYVTVLGKVRGLNTSAYTAGDLLYYNSTSATDGLLTATMPSAPNAKILVAAVLRVHANEGILLVRPHTMPKISDIQDVSISSLANNNFFVYDSATSVWKNKTIAAALGYTPANDSNVVKLTGDQTVAGAKTFTSVINASTLSINGGTLVGNNIVSMRSNPTGGQFRIEKSDGSLSAYPFYVGVDGTALAYYYNASGALKVLLHTNDTSYFGNSLSVGYSTYASTSYMLDVNGTVRLVGALTGTSATFSGVVAIQSNYLDLQNSTYVRFSNTGGGTRWGYIQHNGTDLAFSNDVSGGKFTFDKAAVFTANVSASNFRVYSGATTGGYFIHKAGWVGSGTDYAPSIAAETTYGINFFTNGSASLKMYLATTGQLQLNTYTSATSYTGTAAGYLAFDSSGNVITVAGVAATDNTKLPLSGGTLTGTTSVNAGYSFVANGYNNNGGFAMNNGGQYWGLMNNFGTNDWRLGRGSHQSQNGGWNLRWDAGDNVFINQHLYLNNNYGSTIVGAYSSTVYQGIFAMGDAYKLPLNGSSTGSLYGLAWSHPNAGGVAGNLNTHGLLVMENGAFLAAISGSIRARDDMRAPIFYDSNDTGYYLDPNSTSNLYKFSGGTLSRNNLNRMHTNSPWDTRANQSAAYQNGTMGWGTYSFNSMTNWGSGFTDTWSNPGNAPGGSSHYVGLQSMHHSSENSYNFYGFQMTCAGEADNRFFWRSSWNTPRSWVEMIHSGNIGSQSVNYASSAGNADTVDGEHASNFATHRGEGRNYVEYSRFVYNNGAYSGVGWIEPSDLGVRYASSAGTLSANSTITGLNFGGVFALTGSGANTGNSTGARLSESYGPLWNCGDSATWHHQVINGSSLVGISANGTNYGSGRIYASGNITSTGGNLRSNNWVYSEGNSGWYNDTYGQGLRQVKGGNSTYGNIIAYGENYNGWSGFVTNNSTRTAFMQNSSGDHGFFQDNNYGWSLFFNRGNACWGIGTDNTYSGDGFRCIKYGSAEYGFTTWSDRRAKENIYPITGALNKVLGMNGVYYNYIKDEAKSQHVGFIAQDLLEVLPQSVRYAEDIDEYNINYGPIVSVLAEAIKEQNIEIQSLKAQLQTLLN